MNVTHANALYLEGNLEEAVREYHELAREEGDVLAAFNYGYCLWRGIGTAKDAAAAKSFFVFARDMEGGESLYNLAIMYMHGDGVKRNFKKSMAYMRAAGDRGCVEASLYLGMAYTTGCVYEPDIDGISMIPFHKAEYRPNNLGLLVGESADFEKEEDERMSVIDADAREAFEWFRRAAHHDPTYVESLVAKGQFLYAKCYVDGLGTEFDKDKGVKLMLAAGKSGSAEAVAFLSECGISEERLLQMAKEKQETKY